MIQIELDFLPRGITKALSCLQTYPAHYYWESYYYTDIHEIRADLLRWKTIGIINHDRVLLSAQKLIDN